MTYDEEFELARKKRWFTDQLRAAEYHWFFVQGLDAIHQELYVPGASSLLNGIEASLRVTNAQLSQRALDTQNGPNRREVLNERLIRDAHGNGMPVALLAFPGEEDFMTKLETDGKSPRPEVVRHRNHICHGNVFEFINRETDYGGIFTPECLRELSESLLDISMKWAEGLGEFRKNACL